MFRQIDVTEAMNELAGMENSLVAACEIKRYSDGDNNHHVSNNVQIIKVKDALEAFVGHQILAMDDMYVSKIEREMGWWTEYYAMIPIKDGLTICPDGIVETMMFAKRDTTVEVIDVDAEAVWLDYMEAEVPYENAYGWEGETIKSSTQKLRNDKELRMKYAKPKTKYEVPWEMTDKREIENYIYKNYRYICRVLEVSEEIAISEDLIDDDGIF